MKSIKSQTIYRIQNEKIFLPGIALPEERTIYDNAGNAVKYKTFYPDGSINSICNNYYDSQKIKLKAEWHFPVEGYSAIYYYRHTINGRPSQISAFDESGNKINESLFHYDTDNRETEYLLFDKIGELKLKRTSEYNDTGKLVGRVSVNSDNDLISRLQFEYDESGKLVSDILFGRNDEVEWIYRYSYDSRGNKTEWVRYNPDGTTYPSGKAEFDDDGLKRRSFTYSPKGETETERVFVYSYYPD